MSSRPNIEQTEQFQSSDRVDQKNNDHIARPFSKESFEKGEGHDLFVPASSDWGGGDEAVNSIHSMFRNVEDSQTAMAVPNAWDDNSWGGKSSPLSAQHALKQQCDDVYAGGGGGGGNAGGGDAAAGGGGGGSWGTAGGDTGGATAAATGDGTGATADVGTGTDGGNVNAGISQAEAASVQVIANDGNGEESLGSGFFVSSNGLISTDYHVVQGAQGPIQIQTADGQTLTAVPVVTDQANDIAILQIVGNGANQTFPTLQLAPDGSVSGTDYAVGHPNGDPNINVDPGQFVGDAPFGSFDVTDNTVADNPNRDLLEFGNMDTQPGSSGLAIINANGAVVGMDDIGDGQGNADATLASSIAADVALAEQQAA